MCGITGQLNFDVDRPVHRDDLAAMVQTLVHRGPDGAGYHLNGNAGLGMRRLAVIDLDTGEQPIYNEDRTVMTVFNGEIYNYRELRRDLQQRGHHFYTESDTEVIVHLYEEYGVDFPQRLNGMFAIALWDERRQRLLLTRDHLGIKPLYYALLPDRLLFASELKALRAADLPLTVDLEALSIYLSLLYIPAPHTIYREVRKLNPAETLVWEQGQATLRTYWDLADLAAAPGEERHRSQSALQEEFRNLLRDAVGRQLIADVPLGIFLSGGLDSSAVVAFARQNHSGRLRTFAIGFDDPSYDETAYARIVADHFQTDHTELIVRPDAAGLAHRLVAAFDEPFADSSAIPAYYLCELARRDVTVALGGDGGDELFAGYLTYQADKLARIYDRLPGLVSRRLLPAVVSHLPVSHEKISFDFKARRFINHALLEPDHRHYAWKAFFSPELKRDLLRPELAEDLNGHLDGYAPYRRHLHDAHHLDDLSRFQYADTKVYLPGDNLTKMDRVSMVHSLEVRVPLLDPRLVEFAFRLPPKMRMPGLKLKHFLRESMRGILPDEILRRRKRGFNVPMARWLKDDLRPLVDGYLSPETVRRQGYFEPEVVTALVQDHVEGRVDYSRNLWALLMFNLWVEAGAG